MALKVKCTGLHAAFYYLLTPFSGTFVTSNVTGRKTPKGISVYRGMEGSQSSVERVEILVEKGNKLVAV